MAVIKHPSAGGGDWADDLGTGAEIDGVVSLKSQSSAPSATEEYSKFYAAEAADGETVLLMHFDGSDTSQTMTNDGSGANGIASGTAQLDTSVQKIGTASLQLDGNSDYVSIADSADWTWAGEFTVETWIRFDSLTGWQYIVNSTADDSYFFRLAWNGSQWSYGLMATAGLISDSLLVDTWYHLAMTRDSSDNVRLYRDGVYKGTLGAVSGTVNSNSGITIGRYNPSTNQYLGGYLDEMRILKGTAAYTGTGSFTPPTTAFTATSSEMYVLDAAGNSTKLSPHNSQGDWEYYSKNTKTGKTVRINMEEVVRDLGQLTGKDYIKDE